MTRRTNWPEGIRRRALELYTQHGAVVAARETGVPVGTVKSWASRGSDVLDRADQLAAASAAKTIKWAERRASMVEEMGRVAQLALTKVEQMAEAGDGRNAKDFATAMAILVDKAQLLGGDATSRREVADARRRLHQLRDELAERRKAAA